ncbi:MAG TPA: ribulose-phosphate 3-epimerase [Ignavibacteria bacterium]|nr:ribulose-phosphate 3-epimerase [Ignavibacteria bacterium]
MKKMLAPSILAANFANLEKEIRKVEMAGVDLIHCDVMDGKFVPNITFGPIVINAVKKITRLPLDVHLMIEKPDDFLDDFIKAGASYLTVHQETVVHLHRTITRIKELGAKAGVSINPSTPVNSLCEILEFVDLVLVMSVNPGFGGQKFIESSLKKIRDLKSIREENNYNYLIEVDGGVDTNTITKLKNAGVDIFVAGSAIFSKDNVTAAALELKNMIA